MSFPATKSVGSVYVYNGSISSSNFLLEFTGGTAISNSQEIYTFECEPVVIESESYGVTWRYKGSNIDLVHGVLYSGHMSIPNSITDPFDCIITKYGSASGVEVSSIRYQYASNLNIPTNPNLGIGNSLNDN